MNIRSACGLLCLVCLCVHLSADVIIKGTSIAKPVTVASMSKPDGEYASITQVCDALDIGWEWDFFTEKLTCSANNHNLVICQDVPVYLLDDSLFQIMQSPVRSGTYLYMPVSIITRIFQPLVQKPLTWSAIGKTLVYGTSPFSITSVECRSKNNTTTLSFVVADSIIPSNDFSKRQLVFSLPGATIDTAAFAQTKYVGMVESGSCKQDSTGLHLDFLCAEKCDTPVVEYITDQHKVLVSIKERQLLTAAPESMFFTGAAHPAIRTVVIDPGHGGKDPGALGPTGTQEKDLALGIGLFLRDILKDSTNLKVYMTRSTDEFIALSARTQFANAKKADLFISIHANSIGDTDKKRRNTVSGYEVFFLSEAKNDDARRVAMAENEVVKLETSQNGSHLENILVTLANNEYLRESQDLCVMIDEHFAGLPMKIKKSHNGISQANFFVLNGAYMPSVLIETGYISNSDEEKKLNNATYQKQFALGIYNAIKVFKKKYEAGL